MEREPSTSLRSAQVDRYAGMWGIGNVTKRPGSQFDRLAGGYDQYRPEYPSELLQQLGAHVDAGEHPDPAVVVDVGAGTGIATRLLRQHLHQRYLLIGVEPGAGMRSQAEHSTSDSFGIVYIDSTAEELPYDDGVLAAVVAAQAVQWFDRSRFYAEVCRVLRPGGTLAVLQNNRDWSTSEFLDRYEALMETHNPNYSRHYRSFDIVAELREVKELDVDPPVIVHWDYPVTVDAFIGMAISSSRFQQVIDLIGETRAIELTRELAGGYVCNDGLLRVRYGSELYLARRRMSSR